MTFTASTKKLLAKLLYEKAVCKMLVKFTPEPQLQEPTLEKLQLRKFEVQTRTMFKKNQLI
jgi:hypothetical protein